MYEQSFTLCPWAWSLLPGPSPMQAVASGQNRDREVFPSQLVMYQQHQKVNQWELLRRINRCQPWFKLQMLLHNTPLVRS